MACGHNIKKVALKLHKQFAHPTAEKLINLLKSARMSSTELENEIRELSNTCEVCLKLRKPSPRPAVSLGLGSNFNDAVSIDLKTWRTNLYFLVIVDNATRYCAAAVIKDKNPRTIVKAIFLNWISTFGAPRKILSDNGGEFNNVELRQLAESFNIKIMATAASSPWSNGLCERLNAVLGDLVSKVIEDSACDVETALAWAVSARNALSNFTGYSPNQQVFGLNPALPNLFTNKPPALENVSSSDIVRKNLNALHAARQNFIRIESSEKVRRALRSNIRAMPLDSFSAGDEVYYKRDDSKEWRGPGVVIGRDGKQILVRHGGTYVRVHVCRLAKVPILSSSVDEPTQNPEVSSENTAPDTPEDQQQEKQLHYRPDSETSDSEDETNYKLPYLDNSQFNEAVQIDDFGDCGEDRTVEAPQPSNEKPANDQETSLIRLSKGQRISGVERTSGEFISGTVVGRAGKSTGKYRFCYNLKRDADGSIDWVNLQNVDDLKIVSDEFENQIYFNSADVSLAKDAEIRNWEENGVFAEVDDIGQAAMSVIWVITEKVKNKSKIVKARLVARGFEEDSLSFRTDSPTCSKESIRLAICLATTNGWPINSVDVKSAYLQGDPINREIFLRPPPDYNDGKLWRLNKTVYGLCDAARAWYTRVKSELLGLNVSVCSYDPSLFYWHSNGKLSGIICVYVDDFFWAGTNDFKICVIDKLCDLFLIGSSATQSFTYIGLNLSAEPKGIFIDQHKYASCLEPVKISRQRASLKNSDLTDAEKTDFRCLLGQLNWLSTQTRPDLAFDVCELSSSFKKATVEDLLRLNKLVLRAKGDILKILFPKMSCVQSCSIMCYSDASFANLPDGGSQGGFIIFLMSSDCILCPIYWQSRKVRRVVKSTLAAETLALLDAAEAGVFIAKIIEELSGEKLFVRCKVDNKSLCDAIYSAKSVEDRRLRIDLAVIKDMITRQEIREVEWVASTQQYANCLTKRGASTEQLRTALGRGF